MIYQWKTGCRYGVKAEVAAEIMNKLAEENNLNGKSLVDISRPEGAPLHNEFEWRDDVAGERWREHQARTMIAHLVITHEEQPEQEPVRAFFKIAEGESQYENTLAIFREEEKANRLFEVAMEELKSFRKKYSAIQQFAKLFAAMDEIQIGA